MIENSGFVKDKIEIDHYVFGGGFIGDKKKIIKPDGQWPDNLPFEPQRKGNLETYNCATFNTLKPIQTLAYEQHGLVWNKSDRCLGIFAGTKPPGNSPHTVCEAVRTQGLVDEIVLPFSDDLKNTEEYYSYKNSNPVDCVRLAQAWLDQWDYLHEWAFKESDPLFVKQQKIKDCLQYSPLSISVFAWQEKDGLYYKTDFDSDNHLTEIRGYVEGKYWICRDSYEPEEKHLEWDTNFECAKVHFLLPRTTPRKKPNWFLTIIINIKTAITDIIKIWYNKNI